MAWAGVVAGAALSMLTGLFVARRGPDRRRYVVAVGLAVLVTLPFAWFGSVWAGMVLSELLFTSTPHPDITPWLPLVPAVAAAVGAVAGAGSRTFLRNGGIAAGLLMVPAVGALMLAAGVALWQ